MCIIMEAHSRSVAPLNIALKRAKSRKLAIGVANNGQYGFAVTADGTLGLSLARGAVHTRWGDQPIEPNEHHTFIDQGQIDTSFRLVAGTAPHSSGLLSWSLAGAPTENHSRHLEARSLCVSAPLWLVRIDHAIMAGRRTHGPQQHI